MFGVRFPTRAQIYDFYVHKDLGAGGNVRATALALNPKDADPVRCWYDKLAYEPTVTPMSRGLISAHSPAYPRLRDLTAHLFSRVAWNPDDYQAWRIELAYPTPGVLYAITLHPTV
jgi:hypothetical protein